MHSTFFLFCFKKFQTAGLVVLRLSFIDSSWLISFELPNQNKPDWTRFCVCIWPFLNAYFLIFQSSERFYALLKLKFYFFQCMIWLRKKRQNSEIPNPRTLGSGIRLRFPPGPHGHRYTWRIFALFNFREMRNLFFDFLRKPRNCEKPSIIHILPLNWELISLDIRIYQIVCFYFPILINIIFNCYFSVGTSL